ncbi:MAG: ABC transporter substrate-binding protein [Sphingopyxis sp.]|uniref:ABC transporter substrate-binding protein n=1 Tax=Sphingopyxis sp. TaxID=1908224 RepID=UPI003D80D07A
MRTAASLALLAALTGCQQRAPLPELSGVASVDLCADQMVLGLIPRGDVRAVSVEAASDAGFAARQARGLPRLRPQLEDIVALRPAVVVRSYRGDAQFDRQLAALGIRVVRLGYADTLAGARTVVLQAGSDLNAAAKARQLVAAFDAGLAEARPGGSHEPTALYVTPGDVTTGPGSLVADVIAAAGFTPYRAAPGWGSLPLEDLVRRPPDVVFRAFFDSSSYRQDGWSASRHPVVAATAQRAAEVEVPGAWLACGNWLTGQAVAALADARTAP